MRYPMGNSINKWDQICGLNHCKRGLEVAVAGKHNLLFIGPPGSGKTLLSDVYSEMMENFESSPSFLGHITSDTTGCFASGEPPIGNYVAESLPCPCGYYGEPQHQCLCETDETFKTHIKQINRFEGWFDITLEVTSIRWNDLFDFRNHINEPLNTVLKRITTVRKIQDERGLVSIPELLKMLDDEGDRPLETYIFKLGASAQKAFSALKVARTIADLDNSKLIKPIHLSEAIQYRWAIP